MFCTLEGKNRTQRTKDFNILTLLGSAVIAIRGFRRLFVHAFGPTSELFLESLLSFFSNNPNLEEILFNASFMEELPFKVPENIRNKVCITPMCRRFWIASFGATKLTTIRGFLDKCKNLKTITLVIC